MAREDSQEDDHKAILSAITLFVLTGIAASASGLWQDQPESLLTFSALATRPRRKDGGFLR
jgi:hypothetical protein